MLQGVSWGTPVGLEGPHRAAMSLAWTRTGLQPANSRPNDDSGGRQAPGIGGVDGEHAVAARAASSLEMESAWRPTRSRRPGNWR